MTPTEFEKVYGARLYRYAHFWAKEWKLPAYMRKDLYQAAWLVIGRQLATWEPDGGMSAFNWCASAIKREMTAEFRRYHHNRAYGWRIEIEPFQFPIDEREAVAERVDLDLRLDVNKIVAKQAQTRNLARFLRSAAGDANGTELAHESGQTRQAVNCSLRKMSKALGKALEEFSEDCPSDRPDAQRSVAWLSDFREGSGPSYRQCENFGFSRG